MSAKLPGGASDSPGDLTAQVAPPTSQTFCGHPDDAMTHGQAPSNNRMERTAPAS